MARPRTSKSSAQGRSVQRTYRFNTELFEAFEEDCARHLSNPKLVLEALIVQWLEAKPEARASIALLHRERYGNQSDD